MRVAALDFGSNTTLLLIAEVSHGRIQKVLCDETSVTKLGQGVHQSRRFHPDALKRVSDTLIKYQGLIEKFDAEVIKGVATSAARDVQNQDELIAIAKRYGVSLEVISGQREAELTFLGAVSDQSLQEGLAVIDVGGGSTELIVRSSGTQVSVSVDVGSVRLSDLFVTGHPTSASEVQRATDYADEAFSKGISKLEGAAAQNVIGVAGTPTTLAALEWNEPFSEGKVHGFRLTLDMIDKWIQVLAPKSLKEREQFKGLQPQRADVIVMGAVALRAALKVLKKQELTVSIRGLRYGLAMEMA